MSRYFTDEHEWIDVAGDIATVGDVNGDITTLEDFSVVAALQSEE